MLRVHFTEARNSSRLDRADDSGAPFLGDELSVHRNAHFRDMFSSVRRWQGQGAQAPAPLSSSSSPVWRPVAVSTALGDPPGTSSSLLGMLTAPSSLPSIPSVPTTPAAPGTEPPSHTSVSPWETGSREVCFPVPRIQAVSAESTPFAAKDATREEAMPVTSTPMLVTETALGGAASKG
ncbi:unnamed protein product, partial [Discosporangium mesarthrocarpum]